MNTCESCGFTTEDVRLQECMYNREMWGADTEDYTPLMIMLCDYCEGNQTDDI